MEESFEGEAPEQDPRQAAIQALLKFLRQSEAKVAAPPPAQNPAAPSAPAPEGEEDLPPEALEALKSLMG